MITEHKTFAGFTSHLSVLLIPDRCSHHPKIIRFLLHDTGGSPNIVTRERSEPRSSSVSFDQRYLKMPISSLPFQIQGKFQPMPSQYPPRVILTGSSMWPLPPGGRTWTIQSSVSHSLARGSGFAASAVPTSSSALLFGADSTNVVKRLVIAAIMVESCENFSRYARANSRSPDYDGNPGGWGGSHWLSEIVRTTVGCPGLKVPF